MMTRRTPRLAARDAFTLLELLLATAVGAIVLLVINATFMSALRLHNTTHERIDDDVMVQRALAIVRKDLAGIMLPAAVPANSNTVVNTFSGQLVTDGSTTTTTNLLDNSGERITPDITTSTGRVDGWTPFAEVQVVSYYLSPSADGNGGKDLVRLVMRNLLPATDPIAESQVLLPGVLSAAISYYDGVDWLDTWDSTETTSLPTAFRFSIVMAPRGASASSVDPAPIELVVPVIVTTAATAQEAAAAAAETP